MQDLKRWGGVAALIAAGTYIFGFVLLVTLMSPTEGTDSLSPEAFVALAVDNHALISIWYLVIYVVNGFALALLAAALTSRFRAELPGLGQLIGAVGLIWATLVIGAGMVANVALESSVALAQTDMEAAVARWDILNQIELGLGGGNEIVGGVWALLIGVAGLTTGALPRALAFLSLVIGVSGLATIFTFLGEAPGAIFGLGFIAWFIWVGLMLIRRA